MKSQLIAAIAEDPESREVRRFHSHLAEFLSLDPPTREACIAAIEEYRLCRTSLEEERLVDSLQARTKASRIALEHSMMVLQFLLNALLNSSLPDSDWAHWVSEFQDPLGWLQQAEANALQAILNHLHDVTLPRLKPIIQSRREGQRVTTEFLGCDTTIELRAVRQSAFKLGGSIAEYMPVIESLVPVISIKIRATPDKEFFFQLHDDELQYFVDILNAARKDVKAAQSYMIKLAKNSIDRGAE